MSEISYNREIAEIAAAIDDWSTNKNLQGVIMLGNQGIIRWKGHRTWLTVHTRTTINGKNDRIVALEVKNGLVTDLDFQILKEIQEMWRHIRTLVDTINKTYS